MRFSFALLVFALGCGHIDYGTSGPARVTIPASSAVVYAAPPPPSVGRTAAPVPGVVYVPWDPGAQATAPAPVVVAPAPVVVAPAPVAAPAPAMVLAGNAPVRCGGNERIRLTEEVLDGGDGPAVVATGGCVVEISESILRGDPAVFVSGNARVSLVECRIDGDLRSAGGGQIDTRGSRHERGRVLTF